MGDASFPMSNVRLIQGLVRGEPHGLPLFLERQQPSILHYAAGYMGDAEKRRGVVLHILKRGIGQLHKLRANSLCSSYLLGLLRRHLRRAECMTPLAEAGPLWHGLAKLSRVQREVMFLFFQGHSFSDIAAIRNDAPGLVRSRFVRALQHVRNKVLDMTAADTALHGAASWDDACHEWPPDMFILLKAGVLQDQPRKALEAHCAACPACQKNREGVSAFFGLLREEIQPFAAPPPLLRRLPGLSPVWVAMLLLLSAGATGFIYFIMVLLCRGRVTELPLP